MPVKTYKTKPALVPGIDGGFIPDQKGVKLAKGDTITLSRDGVSSITWKTSQANLDIIETKGYSK